MATSHQAAPRDATGGDPKYKTRVQQQRQQTALLVVRCDAVPTREVLVPAARGATVSDVAEAVQNVLNALRDNSSPLSTHTAEPPTVCGVSLHRCDGEPPLLLHSAVSIDDLRRDAGVWRGPAPTLVAETSAASLLRVLQAGGGGGGPKSKTRTEAEQSDQEEGEEEEEEKEEPGRVFLMKKTTRRPRKRRRGAPNEVAMKKASKTTKRPAPVSDARWALARASWRSDKFRDVPRPSGLSWHAGMGKWKFQRGRGASQFFDSNDLPDFLSARSDGGKATTSPPPSSTSKSGNYCSKPACFRRSRGPRDSSSSGKTTTERWWALARESAPELRTVDRPDGLTATTGGEWRYGGDVVAETIVDLVAFVRRLTRTSRKDAASSSSSSSSTTNFQVGDVVGARWHGGGIYTAEITSRSAKGGTFDIRYQDGSEERHVSPRRIYSKSSSSSSSSSYKY